MFLYRKGSSTLLSNPVARFALKLFATLALMPVSLLYAQSITVKPNGYVTSGPSGQTQFSATVSGLSSSNVVWSVESVNGGSATYGTITSSGIYTAPSTIPAQDPVEITATSTVNSSVSGSTYIDI